MHRMLFPSPGCLAQDLPATANMVARAMPADDPDRIRAAYEEQVRLLTDTLARRDQELGILSAVAARVHGEEDAQRILDIALEEILRQMQLNTAWVFMGDEKEKKLHLAASRGVNPAYLEEIRTEGLGECLCPEVFWAGHRMQVRNTTQCPRMPTIVEGLATPVAHACIPLRFEGQRRGVLNVAARPGEVFSDDELREGETIDLEAIGAQAHTKSIEEQLLLSINDWRSDERVARHLAERWGIGAALLLPLRARKRTLGLLVVTRSESHRWTEEQVETAEALAAQASVALEN